MLEGSLARLAQLAEEDGACQRVPRLAFVQAALRPAPKIDAARPVEHEDEPFQTPQLAQGDRQPVLPRVGGEPQNIAEVVTVPERIYVATRRSSAQCCPA